MKFQKNFLYVAAFFLILGVLVIFSNKHSMSIDAIIISASIILGCTSIVFAILGTKKF